MLWDTATWKKKVTLALPVNSTVAALAFSPDGKTLAVDTGAKVNEKTLQLFDTATWRPVAAFRACDEKEKYLTSLAYSPDGKVLATGGSSGELKLWDTTTWQQKAKLPGLDGNVRSIVFSPDGKTVAAGGYYQRTAKLWDVATGKEKATLQGFDDAVTGIAFSPDGKLLATGCNYGSVRLWDLTDKK